MTDKEKLNFKLLEQDKARLDYLQGRGDLTSIITDPDLPGECDTISYSGFEGPSLREAIDLDMEKKTRQEYEKDFWTNKEKKEQ